MVQADFPKRSTVGFFFKKKKKRTYPLSEFIQARPTRIAVALTACQLKMLAVHVYIKACPCAYADFPKVPTGG